MAKKKAANGAGAPAPEIELISIEDMQAEHLVGDMTDMMLQEVRNVKDKGKPWAQLSEAEQRDMIFRINACARDIARKAIRLIAAKGFDRIDAVLEQGTFKDGDLVLKIKARSTPDNLAIVSRNNTYAQIIFADVQDYSGDGKIKAEPDQKPMFAEGEDAGEEWTDPNTGEVHRGPRQIEGPPVFDQTDAGQGASPS